MGKLSRLLAPREREFFDSFEEAGTNIARAGELIDRLFEAWPEERELMAELVACEHDGDRITHDIIQRLNQTFVTPIDREDIYALASSLDDIVDYIEEAADFLGLYRIEAPMAQAQELGAVLREACQAVANAIPRLRDFRDIHHYTVEINRLENEGDDVLNHALADLFDDATDIPSLIKAIRWNELYQQLEDTTDRAEDVANTLEGIVLKNA